MSSSDVYSESLTETTVEISSLSS